MWAVRFSRKQPNISNYLFVFKKHAGHSKWANIKHIKAEKDGEKAALFTRISRQVRLAVQEGGPDPTLNSQLKSVVDEALRKNMPMSTIQNSIKKSQQSQTELKRYLLQLRHKQKVFAICVLFTDNFAQARMDIAPILKKHGTIQTDVIHLFDEFGLIQATVEKSALPSGQTLDQKATEDAIECGAEDVEIVDENNGELDFICSPVELNGVRQALEKKGYRIENMEHAYSPKIPAQLTGDELKAYDSFLGKLRNMPGVEEIYDNVEHDGS